MEESKTENASVSGSIEAFVASSTSPADRVEALRRVHVFSDLSDDQLKWFADNSEDMRYAAGDVLFRKGESVFGAAPIMMNKEFAGTLLISPVTVQCTEIASR